MNVTQRIDDLCRQHNISKYRLSQITGISQSAFSKMARQQSSLSLETIQRICDALSISVAQFFSEPGPDSRAKAASQFLDPAGRKKKSLRSHDH